jgi:transposase InsO family protein
MQEKTAISQRRACCQMGLSRLMLSYRSEKRNSDAQLQGRLRELAAERKRFGYRRLHVLLRREGYLVNHKKEILNHPPQVRRTLICKQQGHAYTDNGFGSMWRRTMAKADC